MGINFPKVWDTSQKEGEKRRASFVLHLFLRDEIHDAFRIPAKAAATNSSRQTLHFHSFSFFTQSAPSKRVHLQCVASTYPWHLKRGWIRWTRVSKRQVLNTHARAVAKFSIQGHDWQVRFIFHTVQARLDFVVMSNVFTGKINCTQHLTYVKSKNMKYRRMYSLYEWHVLKTRSQMKKKISERI